MLGIRLDCCCSGISESNTKVSCFTLPLSERCCNFIHFSLCPIVWFFTSINIITVIKTPSSFVVIIQNHKQSKYPHNESQVFGLKLLANAHLKGSFPMSICRTHMTTEPCLHCRSRTVLFIYYCLFVFVHFPNLIFVFNKEFFQFKM